MHSTIHEHPYFVHWSSINLILSCLVRSNIYPRRRATVNCYSSNWTNSLFFFFFLSIFTFWHARWFGVYTTISFFSFLILAFNDEQLDDPINLCSRLFRGPRERRVIGLYLIVCGRISLIAVLTILFWRSCSPFEYCAWKCYQAYAWRCVLLLLTKWFNGYACMKWCSKGKRRQSLSILYCIHSKGSDVTRWESRGIADWNLYIYNI